MSYHAISVIGRRRTSFVMRPSHYSELAQRMPTYEQILAFADIRQSSLGHCFAFVLTRSHKFSYGAVRSVRRKILCMHKNFRRMPTNSQYAACKLGERNANALFGYSKVAISHANGLIRLPQTRPFLNELLAYR